MVRVLVRLLLRWWGHHPKFRESVQVHARRRVTAIRKRAERRIDALYLAAGLVPAIKPKVAHMIRMDTDCLLPGQITLVEGRSIRVTRLISHNSRETLYEGVEA